MPTIQRSVRAIATVVAVGLAVVGGSCSSSSTEATESSSPGTDAAAVTGSTDAVTAESLCAEAVPVSSDAVASTELVEASGLVASRDRDGVLWSHNDSGGKAELFALGLDGSDLGRLELTGAQAVDWEDIALLPGVDGSSDLLFAADIGDNFGRGMRTEPVRVLPRRRAAGARDVGHGGRRPPRST